jgi:Helicase associated domain
VAQLLYFRLAALIRIALRQNSLCKLGLGNLRRDWDGTTTIRDLLESKWMDRLRDLVRYKERNGECNVPFQFKEDQRLANWVLKQRKL